MGRLRLFTTHHPHYRERHYINACPQITKSLTNFYWPDRTRDSEPTRIGKFRGKFSLNYNTILLIQNNILIISQTLFSREQFFHKLIIHRHLVNGFTKWDVDLNFSQHLLELFELLFFFIFLLRFLCQERLGCL